ncbi:helix-turn-helix domain-containing protein [Amycolatopsis carbonis]|uniref:Helix-turn-helix domain-containing protein n=1 Tax=Amycolatopsis carbonis TaxID=715471 RepID=A0A9Y2IKD7_9PSEU|nr:helix-turn-helix domain-containing protein [Amycolatopsis sp. 2-15]WIX81712.1 helix-turn-helix domain-containing protein [Amycolatopsis sp. 2-15]
MDKKLLSVDDLAGYLDVPVNTVYQWRKTGKGPKGYKIGKYVRFRADEVDAWIDGQGTA